MRDVVADFEDPRLDDYRNIPDPALLAERRIFVAEGRLVVSRLLSSGRFTVRSLMLTRAAADALDDTLGAHPGVAVFEVSQDTMNRVSGFNMHRGCLAIGERPADLDPAALIRSSTRLVALEAVGNADNVGAIFRSAVAFGADGVLLNPASADPLYRKALRTSMGAALQVRFARATAWIQTLRACQAAGFRLLALTPAREAAPIADLAPRLTGGRTCLVLGHEGQGLSDSTLAACDLLARIPIRPEIDSLNVATAAAIALYEVGSRQ